MKVRHTLICVFFLTLRDRNTGLINAEILDRTGTEGGNVTVECSFTFSGSRKFFCKKECEEKDILVETTGDRAQSGRYSIEYREGSFPVSPTLLYVSITNLTKSDSGRYRCSLDRYLRPGSYEDFDIRVGDAPAISKPNWTLRPFPTSIPSASTLTTTETTSSAVPGPATTTFPETNRQPADFLLVLVVCVLVLVVVLSAVVLLLLYKKKMKDSDGLNKRGNSDRTGTEMVIYENCPPVSTCEDSIYQSLDPASRDQDQTYSTLTQIQHR